MKSANGWINWRIDAGGMLIAVVLTTTAYLGHISPTLSRREAADARQLDFNAEQTKAHDLERTLHTAQDRFDRVRQQAAGSQLQLQSISELNSRLARLTEWAGQNGLQVDAVESSPAINRGKYAAVPIRIAGHASYRNCVAALKVLRESMPDIGVVGFEMDSQGIATDTPAIFSFQLYWHTQPLPKTATK